MYATVDCLAGIVNPEITESMVEDDEDGRGVFETADVFRMGRCDIFSIALSREFGYAAYKIGETEDGLTHSFCVTFVENQMLFVDIRGMTTDLEQFCSGFVFETGAVLTRQDIEKEYRQLDDAGRFGYRFAERIIDGCRSRYDSSSFIF